MVAAPRLKATCSSLRVPVGSKTQSIEDSQAPANQNMITGRSQLLFVHVLCDCFRSRRRLESEILVLRHQLNVLQQRAPHRLCLTWINRALFAWLYRGFPRILDAITILRPDDRALASQRLRCILAMEIPPPRWPTADQQRGARSYPKNEL
jgi:hypothetical protein